MGKGFSGTFTTDGKGGLILPNEAVESLRKADGAFDAVWVDGIPYPFVVYEGKKYPIVETEQVWTIGGAVAAAQHAKNVAKEAATKTIAIQVLEPQTDLIQ